MYKLSTITISLIFLVQGQVTNQTQLSREENSIENAINSANNYVTTAIKLANQITKYISSILNGHFDQLNTGNESQIQNCTISENNTITNLSSSTSQAVMQCLEDIEPKSTQLITNIIYLLQDISETVSDILQRINTCIEENEILIGLPACLYNLQQPINDDLKNVTSHLNDTISLVFQIVPTVSNQTVSCLMSAITDFLRTAYNALVNYTDCISTV